MNRLSTNIILIGLLAFVFLIGVFSIKDDSLTFDETSHIASGYSYLTQKDYRLNPEHPPLIKDLAAIPLLFLNLNFPKDSPSWIQKENPVWWHQFDLAGQFLYHSGNNPDRILFWARLPMILVLVFLGFFIFTWARKLFGEKTALFSLFLFSFSPTFLAHGRLVTTDVGAALGALSATFFWLKFLEFPEKKNIIFAGLVFGAAMLLKFSLILLIPFFAFLTLIYICLKGKKYILKYLFSALLAGAIGMVFVVWPVYQYHIWNYPKERQIRDTQYLLDTSSLPKPLIGIDKWMSEKTILRPFSQYFLGVLLVINRGATGNTTYFLGEISAEGWKKYFPIVYLIKEALAFHILTLIALLYAVWRLRFRLRPSGFGGQVKNWLQNHFAEFAMLSFIGLYWATSISGKLNIGVRHLMPVFPFTILLVSAAIIKWLNPSGESGIGKKLKYLFLGIIIFWQVFSVLKVYPHFLAYFNELAGGPDKGYLYVTDSNLDWGQDLKRLKKWVENPPAGGKIEKIYVDYFGGGNPQYYLKEKFLPWQGTNSQDDFPKGNYLAVSVNSLQGGRGKPIAGLDMPNGYYRWLDNYTPVTKIGYSIFVYYIGD